MVFAGVAVDQQVQNRWSVPVSHAGKTHLASYRPKKFRRHEWEARIEPNAEGVSLSVNQDNIEREILAIFGDHPNGVTTAQICRIVRKTPQDLGSIFEALIESHRAVGFAGLWLTIPNLELAVDRFLLTLGALQEEEPTRGGFPPEQVAKASELDWIGKPLDRIVARLVTDGKIETGPSGIRALNVTLQLTPRQRALLDRVIAELETEPVNTPTPNSIAKSMGVPIQAVDEILRLGVQAGEAVRIDEGVFYTPRQLEAIKLRVATETNGEPFSMTDLRDKLQTTRKYIAPLLDYFDSVGLTEGDRESRRVRR